MKIAKFKQIKQIFDLKDDEFYSYTVEADGSLMLQKVKEYEILGE
ncbi:hypothetical protein [Crocosphaera sp. Alani8]